MEPSREDQTATDQPMDAYRVDRSALSVGWLGDDSNRRTFWRARSPAERIEAMQLLREISYGTDAATARLSRVLEVVERPPG